MSLSRRKFFGAVVAAVVSAPVIAKACAKPPAKHWIRRHPMMSGHMLDGQRYVMFSGRRSGKSMLAQQQAYAAMARGETVKMISPFGTVTFKPL